MEGNPSRAIEFPANRNARNIFSGRQEVSVRSLVSSRPAVKSELDFFQVNKSVKGLITGVGVALA